MIVSLKRARPLRLTLFGTSPKGRGLGKTTNFISSPEALPLGELARKRLRGRGRWQILSLRGNRSLTQTHFHE